MTRQPITVTTGSRFGFSLFWFSDAAATVPLDITGRTFAAQVREAARSAQNESPAAQFTVTVDGPAGRVDLALSAVQTSLLRPGVAYTWDCDMRESSGVDPVSVVEQSPCRVKGDVTR